MQIIQHSEDLATATGTMRNYIYRPASEQRYPAIVFYEGKLHARGYVFSWGFFSADIFRASGPCNFCEVSPYLPLETIPFPLQGDAEC